jgi:hypothetical protein
MRCTRLYLAVIALGASTAAYAQSDADGSSAASSTGTQGGPVVLSEAPRWLKNFAFKQNSFTFVRVKYGNDAASAGPRGRRFNRASWATDFPDAELNLCRQIESLTKLTTDAKFLELTDATLSDYPLIYLNEPGQMQLTDAEVAALRKYLENGGLLMIDDFWGDAQYEHCTRELKRVFPEREPNELPLEHELFHCVFDFDEKPQVPSIATAIEGRAQGVTWEEHGGDSRVVHYKSIDNDAGRIMVLLCHNTDLGDGWERSGEDAWYAEEFSAKRALPMGVNIVFYALVRP